MPWAFLRAFTVIMANDKKEALIICIQNALTLSPFYSSLYAVLVPNDDIVCKCNTTAVRFSARTLSVEEPEFLYILHNLY